MNPAAIPPRQTAGAALALLLAAAGCTSIGPGTVPRDRFDYSAAITESWKRQMLLNVVKLRYLDPPIFVDVGQIVSGYTLETGATAGVSVPEGGSIAGTTLSLGGSGKFTDRPTITYVPMTGSKFISGMMTPLPPWALFNAIQNGWPADAILFMGAANINGLSAESNNLEGVTQSDERFLRVAHLMREMQLSGMFGMRIIEDEAKHHATLITLRSPATNEAMAANARELRTLLGLDPEATEFRLVFGAIAGNNREIAVTSRSLIRILGVLAAHVEVPPEDIAEGRATPGISDASNIRFRCSKEAPPPQDAFVSVPYRGRWYWIDDRDLRSKRAFALIMLLFTMSDTDTNTGLPVLTIPTS